MKLNNTDIQPLYQQLADDLVKKINEGTYPAGSKLPTEDMLSDNYGVSRITVRSALKKLSADNVVVSKQGKGTFVCATKLPRNISTPNSFNQFCRERGYTPNVDIVFLGYRDATRDDRKVLALAENEVIVVIERVLKMDHTPVIYEQFHFPQRYSFLLGEDLEDTSILGVLSGKYGFVFSNLHRSIELVYATKEVSRLLQVPSGYPLLFIDSHVADEETNDRCRSTQFVVGDKFKFEF